MSISNGSLVARPVNRLAEVWDDAAESAEITLQRQDDAAEDEQRAARRAAEQRDRASQLAIAEAKCRRAREAIRALHARHRAQQLAAPSSPSEALMREAVLSQEIDANRSAMLDAMAPIVGSGPAVERAVDGELKKLAAEACDVPAKPLRNGDILPEQD